MSTDADRQALYRQVRNRFITDPDYRAAMRSDTVGTLEGTLGELTPEEREWVSRELPDPSTSDADLVNWVQKQQSDPEPMAW